MSNKKTNFALSNVKTNQLNLITYMANIKELYNELIKTFLIENNIKEVICKDMKEHFFDKIIVTDKENRIIKIYDNGYILLQILLNYFQNDKY